jgi:predicted chitinase
MIIKYTDYKLNEDTFNWRKVAKSDQEKLVQLNKNILLSKLIEAGITDPKAQANILAQIKHESGFIPKRELTNYSAERLMELWGPKEQQKSKRKNAVKFPTIQHAQAAIKKGPEYLFGVLYGKRKDLGNDKFEDGYKYRGGGLIQLTGKHNYTKASKQLGVDLVNNPELAADPEYAFDIAVKYFERAKKERLTDIDYVNRVVGFGTGESEGTARKRSAKRLENEIRKGKIKPLKDVEKTIATLATTLKGSANLASVKKEEILGNTNQQKTITLASAPEPEKDPYIKFDPEKVEMQSLDYFKSLDPNKFGSA